MRLLSHGHMTRYDSTIFYVSAFLSSLVPRTLPAPRCMVQPPVHCSTHFCSLWTVDETSSFRHSKSRCHLQVFPFYLRNCLAAGTYDSNAVLMFSCYNLFLSSVPCSLKAQPPSGPQVLDKPTTKLATVGTKRTAIQERHENHKKKYHMLQQSTRSDHGH